LVLISLGLAFWGKFQYQYKYLGRIYASEPTPCGQSLSKERGADERHTVILSQTVGGGEASGTRSLLHFG